MSEGPGFFLDAETRLVSEQFAVIYAPRRRRSRFPANCVTICNSEGEALAQANPDRHHYAAKMLGPSKSSEGVMMFYLIRWLE